MRPRYRRCNHRHSHNFAGKIFHCKFNSPHGSIQHEGFMQFFSTRFERDCRHANLQTRTCTRGLPHADLQTWTCTRGFAHADCHTRIATRGLPHATCVEYYASSHGLRGLILHTHGFGIDTCGGFDTSILRTEVANTLHDPRLLLSSDRLLFWVQPGRNHLLIVRSNEQCHGEFIIVSISVGL